MDASPSTGALLPSLFLGGGEKKKDTFQPINLTFDHTKRTTFDGGANVRARVRFRMEGKYPVAWLDDLHNMNLDLSGRGKMQGAWDLPGSAPYVGYDDPAKPTILAEFVGGVKIWRVENDMYRIKFYGPRSRLPFAGEPSLFAVYAEVPVANATKWDPETWTVRGPKLHHYAFMRLLKKGIPRIMSVLMLMPDQIVAQTAEDERVRAWWAKRPTYPVTVYKQ